MKLSFGNMTLELNVFHISRQARDSNDEVEEVNLIETVVEDMFNESSARPHGHMGCMRGLFPSL